MKAKLYVRYYSGVRCSMKQGIHRISCIDRIQHQKKKTIIQYLECDKYDETGIHPGKLFSMTLCTKYFFIHA